MLFSIIRNGQVYSSCSNKRCAWSSCWSCDVIETLSALLALCEGNQRQPALPLDSSNKDQYCIIRFPLSPFAPYVLLRGPKTCQIWHQWDPDFADRISQKPLDRFTPVMELSMHLVVQCHSKSPICAIWACPWVKNLSNQVPLGPRLCGTRISETAGCIYTVQNSMELSKPVAVQHHRLMTLILDFQSQM